MLTVSFSKFIGRQPELQALEAGLDHALQGRGRVFILSGDAGIGKTRLAEELVHDAQTRGAKVLRGTCYEYQGAPAFWPWSQIIRAQTDEDAPSQSGLEVQAGELAPGLGGFSLALQPDHARFRLFDAISTTLRRAAEQQPLVLVLDDLHWADKPSLLLLEFFAREIENQPLMLLACYRDFEAPPGHPLAQTLGYLVRLPITERIALRGFSQREVLEFLREATGQADEASAERIHADTSGNPLFIGEIVRLSAEAGHAAALPGQPLPRGIHDLISRRLQGLSGGCRHVLEVASVLGRQFSLVLLGQLTALTNDELMAALDEAEKAHVLESSGQLGQYMFTHALVQQSLHDGLTAARRLQLHHQVGAVLERLHEQGANVPLAELAYHFLRAVPLAEPIKAFDYARSAGEEALRALAFEQAAEHFGQALQALRAGPVPGRERELEVLLWLGDAEGRAGDRARAKRTFLEAAALARELGAADKLAQAALGYGGVWVTAGSLDQVLVDLVEESLSRLATESGALTARLRARLAQELYYTADEDSLDDLTADAVASARASGDSQALAAGLSSRHQALRRPGDLRERLSVADEIIRLAKLAGDDELALQGHHWKLVDLVESGEPEGVEAEQSRCLDLTNKLRQPYHQWWTMVPRATLAMLRGDFKGGEELARSALAAGRRAQEASAGPFFEAQLFVLRLEGVLAPDTDILRDLADRFPTIPVWRAALAWLQAENEQQAAARDDFLRLFDGSESRLPRDGNETIGLACLAAACCALGDRDRAGSLYAALLPYAERNVHTARLSACFGPAGLFLGQLARLLGKHVEAKAHLERAIKMSQRMGSWPWLARAEFEYSQLLLALRRPESADEAASLDGHARTLAREYGLDRLLERMSRTPATRPAGLTARESEILALLSGGLSSQEISQRLVLSIHTVNRHVANIYAKIGARGRAEATAFAFRHGVVGDA